MSKKPSATALAPAIVTKVAFAPETAPKPATGKGTKGGKNPETFVDQTVVDAFLTAEQGVKESAVALFAACVHHRVSPAQFVGRSDAKVRASEFNCARAAGMLLGVKGALKLIADAANKTGDKRANVLAALRQVKAVAPELKGSALKGAALATAIVKKADAAAQTAADTFKAKADERKASRIPRVNMPKAGTVDAFAPVLLAALTDTMAKMSQVTAKPGQLSKWKELVEMIDEAHGLCAELVKA